MPLPKIDEASLNKPLCYDPMRRKYILYEEIIAGKEKIIPVDALSDNDFKKLAIKRLKEGPDFRGGPMGSPFLSRDDTIRAIRSNSKFGRQFLEGEKSMLRDFLADIERNL